jgi:hypothetical protein
VKRRLSPQQKKLLSYENDGRNTFAEARSKSRKSIAANKAQASRALRRAETVATAATLRANPEEVDAFIPRIGRKSWKKIPDAPLADYVSATLTRRRGRGMNERLKESALLKKARKSAAPRRTAPKGPLQNDGDG